MLFQRFDSQDLIFLPAGQLGLKRLSQKNVHMRCVQIREAFKNSMTIGITPKNEVLRVKSLKQPILQEIKEYSKIRKLWTP